MTSTMLPSRSQPAHEATSLAANFGDFTIMTTTSDSTAEDSQSSKSSSGVLGSHNHCQSASSRSSTSDTSPLASTPAKPTPSLLKRRRPSALFGKSPFKFTIRHRRKSSAEDDERRGSSSSSSTSSISPLQSPPLSPTTTISPGPSSTTRKLKPELRCAPSDDSAAMGFPFGKAVPTGSQRGRDLGSVDEDVPISPLVFKAHPGTLVTFPSASEPTLATSAPEQPSSSPARVHYDALDSESSFSTTSSTGKTCVKDYHRYLKASNFHRQKVDRTSTSCYFHGAGTHAPNQSRPARLENIDYQARKLERRARSLEQQERILREGPSTPQLSASAPVSPRHPRHLSLGTPPQGPDSRKGSGGSGSSSDSAEMFLRSVRASFDARRSRDLERSRSLTVMKVSYNVFADEDERGFIGDEPL